MQLQISKKPEYITGNIEEYLDSSKSDSIILSDGKEYILIGVANGISKYDYLKYHEFWVIDRYVFYMQ